MHPVSRVTYYFLNNATDRRTSGFIGSYTSKQNFRAQRKCKPRNYINELQGSLGSYTANKGWIRILLRKKNLDPDPGCSQRLDPVNPIQPFVICSLYLLSFCHLLFAPCIYSHSAICYLLLVSTPIQPFVIYSLYLLPLCHLLFAPCIYSHSAIC